MEPVPSIPTGRRPTPTNTILCRLLGSLNIFLGLGCDHQQDCKTGDLLDSVFLYVSMCAHHSGVRRMTSKCVRVPHGVNNDDGDFSVELLRPGFRDSALSTETDGR